MNTDVPEPIDFPRTCIVPKIARMQAEIRAANERADKAERALAAHLAKMRSMGWETVRQMNQDIARLRKAGDERNTQGRRKNVKLAREAKQRWNVTLNQLSVAWLRIEALEAEAEQLRNQHKGESI